MSAPAATMCRPSGVKATAFSSPCGWFSVSSRSPSLTRQSFTVWSALAEASTVPVGSNARLKMAPLCTEIVRSSLPSATCQSRMVRSYPAVARTLPSGDSSASNRVSR